MCVDCVIEIWFRSKNWIPDMDIIVTFAHTRTSWILLTLFPWMWIRNKMEDFIKQILKSQASLMIPNITHRISDKRIFTFRFSIFHNPRIQLDLLFFFLFSCCVLFCFCVRALVFIKTKEKSDRLSQFEEKTLCGISFFVYFSRVWSFITRKDLPFSSYRFILFSRKPHLFNFEPYHQKK